MKKNIGLIIAIVLIVALIGYIVASNVVNATKEVKNPIVTMEVENFGKVVIELYPDVAPNTVANFISLINEGYYDGTTFNRAVEGFMVQGGEKEAVAETQTIKGEFLANGYEKNTLRHDRGVISMVKYDYSSLGLTEEGYNSAYAQFYIMTDDNENMNGFYAAFGKVIDGMEVVDEIAKVKSIQYSEDGTKITTDNDDQTEEETNPKITKMTVDTFGVDYGTPVRQEAFDLNSYLMRLYGLSI